MTGVMNQRLVPIGHVDALGPCAYRSWRPIGAPDTVAAVWRSEVIEPGPLVVVPDGCVELVRSDRGEIEVWGPSYRPVTVVLRSGASYDGVRLRAGAASATLGVPSSEIAGRVVTPADLGLLRQLENPDRQEWLAHVFALAERGTAAWRDDSVAFLGPALLEQSGLAVTGIAARLGVGERQLRRRFHDTVGLTPSAFRRVVRVRRALRELRTEQVGSISLADIAYRGGFADQAHLTKQVVALTGVTPGALKPRNH